jgi:hypothetical protein
MWRTVNQGAAVQDKFVPVFQGGCHARSDDFDRQQNEMAEQEIADKRKKHQSSEYRRLAFEEI